MQIAALPGREHRFGVPATPENVALAQVQQALSALDDMPTAVYGHSFGALLAYELARLGGIDRLIVSGSAPPSALPPLDHGLDDASLVAKLREWKGTPPQLLDDPDALAAILEPLRDDLAMLERLRQQVPAQLDLPIHALVGRQDHEATATAMQGWAGLTRGHFSLGEIDGDHFFPITHPSGTLAAIAGLLEL
jgi:surfactin synthase thioesterase subunit